MCLGEVVGAIKSNGLSGTSRFAPDAALVERYEVLKGPASIVGGATRPGGTINRISKRPTAERQAVAQVEAGSFDFYRGLADVSGAVTDNNAVRVRFIAAAETGGEYVDQVDAQQFTISPSLEVDTFDGAGTLFLTGYYQRFDGSSYAGGPLLQDGSIPGNAPTVNLGCLDADVCGAFTEAEIKNVEVHYDHDIVDNLAMSLKGRYLKSEITTLELSPFGNTNNETSIWAGYSPLNGTTYTGEASLKKGFAAFGGNHEILGGVDYLKTESESGTSWMFLGQQSITDPQIVYSVSPSDFGPLSLRETTLKQASVFGQAVLRPLDRVTFVGGIRNDWVDISNINVSMTNERTESELTYRAGASVRVFDFMNVYAGYQQSFLPNSTATDQSGALLPSETGQNYEVGAKFDILDGNMSLTTALFRTYRQNVATPDPDAPPGSTASVSNGEERSQGFEMDLNGQPYPGLRVNANLSFVDIEITETTRTDELGNAPFRTPRSYFGRVFATYEIQTGTFRGLGFGGGVYFNGGYHLDALDDAKSAPYQRVDLVGFYGGGRMSSCRSMCGT